MSLSGEPGSEIEIVECVLRDGLQDAPYIATEAKMRLLELLLAAGHRSLELTSFVSSRRMPQFADAETLTAAAEVPPHVRLTALVANERGLQRALNAGCAAVNVSMDLATVRQAVRAELSVGAYLSTLIGDIWAEAGARRRAPAAAARLLEIGVERVLVADVRDAASAEQFDALLRELREAGVPPSFIELHLHDDNGRALDKAMCAVAQGVRTIDASLGGAGREASSADASPARGGGNLATARMAAALGDAGYETGLNLELLADAEDFLEHTLASSRQTA